NAAEKLRAFWAAIGARVEIMTPDHHDMVLAITSHLPHLIAYTIVGTADELEGVTQSELLKFSAGRLPALHALCLIPPAHVARRVPDQQGRGAENARPFPRGSLQAPPPH